MSETLLKQVQEMLNEEKWTRSTLSNYSISQFKELDGLLEAAQKEHALAELRKMCEEHLSHTKMSIIALYLSGMAALSDQILEDAAMMSLIKIFQDNHKVNIVRFLCERILAWGESKLALRILADCVKSDDNEEELCKIWERLVKVDFTEADLAKALAERAEKNGDLEGAVDYYKKAIHRYITKGDKNFFIHIREIWGKLLKLCPEEIDYFLLQQKRVAGSQFGEDKAVVLLQDLYQTCRARDDLDTAIEVLKLILDYDERYKDKNVQPRRELVNCFRQKYAYHSQVDEFIRVSNLNSHYRSVHDAIRDFEKHIAFDKGNFVFHRSWGVGRIAELKGPDIQIDFAKKRNHTMSLKMAVDSLQILAKDHIWVLKATWKKEKLHDKVKEDVVWALSTVIRSFGNACDFKRIKAELSPSILSSGEWVTWNNKARDILKNDPAFGVSPDSVEVFTVRERPASLAEKLYYEFRAEKDFFSRVHLFRKFADEAEAEELASDDFAEMYMYFLGLFKPNAPVTEQTVAAFFLVKNFAGQFPQLSADFTLTFPELFSQIGDIAVIYEKLKDFQSRKQFLERIKTDLPDWENIYLKLFPREPQDEIIKGLEAALPADESLAGKLRALTVHCFENYRDCKAAVYWLFKNRRDAPWYQAAGLSLEKQLVTLVHIIDLSYKEIENRRNSSENRKLSRQVYASLFTEGEINRFVEEAGKDTAVRLFTLINDVKDLDQADKIALRNRIGQKYPEFKATLESEKKVSRGLIVTLAKYTEKQQRLDRIKTEEIPANSKEIEFALSLGDLRENAEYKAAKEKQTLLNSTMTKLQDEISRAQIFDPSTVTTNRISFGTRVVLHNNNKNEDETYTILGPWESDPEHHIISYLSPFGKSMMDKAAGDSFERDMGSEKVSYKVLNISVGL
ncbi:MAG: transcription elongation factor GreA [Treponema sp.]|nr:transcription elongation factor GreA [Treponema sp.]